jgi:hypothetical protein
MLVVMTYRGKNPVWQIIDQKGKVLKDNITSSEEANKLKEEL